MEILPEEDNYFFPVKYAFFCRFLSLCNLQLLIVSLSIFFIDLVRLTTNNPQFIAESAQANS